MSGLYDAQAHQRTPSTTSPPSSSTTNPVKLEQLLTTTTTSTSVAPPLYHHYSTPSAHHSPSVYPHTGLPTLQNINVNGSRHGQGQGQAGGGGDGGTDAYTSSPADNHHRLSISYQIGQQEPHGQRQQHQLSHPHQQHHQPKHHHHHSQDASPIHYQPPGGNHGPSTPTSLQPPAASVSALSPPINNGKKNTRIPRACDLCSQRKVKCEGGPPPCQPCRELNVACTYNRVKRRRGPPNRAAEAAREAEKRRRLDTDGLSEATPPLQNAAQALVSLGTPSGQVVMDAEQCIAPLGVLQLLVDDFFTYIHPLTPFPHEPTFREAFKNREDRTNPEFLSLLASMIGGLVASFPRSARLHLKAAHSYDKFPRAIMLVDRCMKVALAMRPTDYMLKDVINVNDAAISYFLCLGAAYTMRPNQCRRFLGESLLFLREMGFHKKKPPPTSLSFGSSRPDDRSNDFISDEIGKRIFWCIFLGVRSMSQLGASSRDLIIPPATPNMSYPEFPREVDDAYILADRILPQPEGTISTLTGFVKCAQIYRTMDDLVRIELSHGIAAYAWDQQKQYLHSALAKMREVAESLPPELKVDMKRLAAVKFPYAKPGQEGSGVTDYQYVPAAYPQNQPINDVRHLFAQDESKKRKVQYEIQKANIYASLLATRSHYVERYLSLRDVYLANQRAKAQADASGSIVYRTAADFTSSSLAAAAVQAAAELANDNIDHLFLNAREEVVQDLFSVLVCIDQRHMEPNGGSLISKIRQVACTLLSDRSDRKGQHELHNEEYLRAFLDILTRLEKTGTGTVATSSPASQDPGSTMTAQDEEQELRNWADLHEQQQKLAQSDYVG